MKIAITSTGLNLESDASLVFGRSPFFVFADISENEIANVLPIENPAKNERGAGSVVAQFMVDQGVEAVILGELGNIAFGILKMQELKYIKLTLEMLKLT
ncbi:NifB/NifX family molybdenum-iron cluster-binding protein [Methanobacterium sp. ACI-7]|uniref:NifB/NifX family molybdenum-iron cluster-binding protein n=1 Tax=unclassified Methanobacterium TaxID=2627676 RepID=UPI0039C4C193